MASSCSSWWQALITIFVSIILAIGAISSSIHSSSKSEITPKSKPFSSDNLALHATRALRNSGFNFMATVLQISAEQLLLSSGSTIFAIQDPAMANISLPPWLMRDLLLYHTAKSKLLNENLLQKSVGSCVPTILHGKNLVITKADPGNRSIEINGVSISHPDIFTEGPFAIHGVLAPFYSFQRDDYQMGEIFIPSPACNLNSSIIANETEPRTGYVIENRVPWPRILRLLSSNGFISFSIGLHAVLDGILQDFKNLSAVTVFASVDEGFAYVASPSPLLERIVRFHILPGKYFYRDLVLMPEYIILPTLLSEHDLIKTSGVNFSEILTINNVEIIEPDAFSSKEFVIHGISQIFEMVKLSGRSH